MNDRFCWTRLRRHRFRVTGMMQIAGGSFNRGQVLRCVECGYETAAVGDRLKRLARDV